MRMPHGPTTTTPSKPYWRASSVSAPATCRASGSATEAGTAIRCSTTCSGATDVGMGRAPGRGATRAVALAGQSWGARSARASRRGLRLWIRQSHWTLTVTVATMTVTRCHQACVAFMTILISRPLTCARPAETTNRRVSTRQVTVWTAWVSAATDTFKVIRNSAGASMTATSLQVKCAVLAAVGVTRLCGSGTAKLKTHFRARLK